MFTRTLLVGKFHKTDYGLGAIAVSLHCFQRLFQHPKVTRLALPFPKDAVIMWWSDLIPPEQQARIGQAVTRQLPNLPVNLFLEWFEPKRLERRWFVEANKWIDIPYPEYWQDSHEHD